MRGWAIPERLDALLRRIPWYARRRPRYSRAEVLGAIPTRNPLIGWEPGDEAEEAPAPDALVLLKVPRRQDRLGKILNRLVSGPDHKRVELDELGSEVWRLCDGERNVDGVIRELARRHQLSRLEVEASLTAFLRTLAKRGFIGLKLGEPVQRPGGSARARRRARRRRARESRQDSLKTGGNLPEPEREG